MPFGRHYLFWNSVGVLGCIAVFVFAVVYEPWFAVIPGAVCLLQAYLLGRLIRYKRIIRRRDAAR